MLLELDIEAIQQLLDSPSQLLTQAKKAYETVEQCYSWWADQVKWTDHMNDMYVTYWMIHVHSRLLGKGGMRLQYEK